MNGERERNGERKLAPEPCTSYSRGLVFGRKLLDRSVIRYVRYTQRNYHLTRTKVFARFDRAAPHRFDALGIIIFYAYSGRAFVAISQDTLHITLHIRQFQPTTNFDR